MAEDRKVGISIILKDKMSTAFKKAGKAAEALKKKADQIRAAFAKFAEMAKPFAIATAAITAAGAAAFMLTKKIANAGDQMIKGAQRLTMTTDAYQKFNHIMQISGTSMDQQRGSMTRFTRTARDAANGVKVAEEAFGRLNVKVKNTDGSFKTTEQLMYEVSDSFKEMPPTVEKSALMMDMFGRSGAQLAQMLNLGSEGMKELGTDAERLGGVMSEDAAKKSEEFVDAMTRLDTAVGGVTRTMGENMQPMFTRAMESMANSTVKLRSAFAPVFKDMMVSLQQAAVFVVPIIGFIGKAFIGLGTTVTLAWKGILLVINLALSAIVEEMNSFIHVANALGESFGIAFEPIENVFKDTATEIVGEMGNVAEAGSQAMSAVDDLGDAILGLKTDIHDTTPAMEAARVAMGNLGKGQRQLTKEELKAIEDRKKAKLKAERELAKADKIIFNEEKKLLKEVARDEKLRLKNKEKNERNAMKRLRAASEERKAIALQEINAIAAGADAMGSAFVSAYSAAEEGQNKVAAGGKAMAGELVDQGLAAMQKFITMEAAKAAAAAATTSAWLGPAAAAASAAIMFSMVRGLVSLGFQSMADGGFVTGGKPNKDSVPTMLMPGEYVMSKKEVAAAQQGSPGRSSSSGNVNVSISTTVPPNRAEMKRYIRQNLVPAMRELKGQGMSF